MICHLLFLMSIAICSVIWCYKDQKDYLWQKNSTKKDCWEVLSMEKSTVPGHLIQTSTQCPHVLEMEKISGNI